MNSCRAMTLTENDHSNISICEGCKRIGLCYKNLVFGFYLEEYFIFCKKVNNINFHQEHILLGNGQANVIIDTHHSEIHFCLNAFEFVELSRILDESLIMIEVYDSLKIR
tara:strand:+ start:350 stop:679 length:330 start_codon:yes stop_codon:yes gene_type:complete